MMIRLAASSPTNDLKPADSHQKTPVRVLLGVVNAVFDNKKTVKFLT
jgi:hypothetical protein